MFFLFVLFVIIVVLLYTIGRILMCEKKVLIKYVKFEEGDAASNLFIKYGGLQTVQAVVDSAVTNLLAEESLASVFSVVGTPNHRSGDALKACLDLQFQSLLGGPLLYPGKTFTRGVIVDARTMKASHRHLTITKEQFNTFVAVLIKTLLDAGVTQTDVDELAPTLNGMVCDIVTVS